MNKMRRSRTNASEIETSIKQAPGVYGKGGGPGFESYPQTQGGENNIPFKTAETTMGTAKTTTNQLRRSASNTRFGLEGKQATSTTMKTSKNKYRQSRTKMSEVK